MTSCTGRAGWLSRSTSVADRSRLLVARLPVPADRRRRRVLVQQPSSRLSTTTSTSSPSTTGATPADPPDMCDAVVHQPRRSASSPRSSPPSLGTLIAFALVRHRFRGRAATNLLIFLPMATPEVVMGTSLLALFVNAGLAGQLGFWTIVIAHIMFCLSFVVVTVKARLAGLDPRLEQAAMDLYANEWQTFRRVTLPLVLPGIAGRRAAAPSRCPSTTSSSPTSTPAAPSPSRCSSGARRSAASRRRSTSSARRCSSSALLAGRSVGSRRAATAGAAR